MNPDSKIEQVPVTIEVAVPSDAKALAELKYQNVSHRAKTGLLPLSPDGEKIQKITAEETVQALTETLARTTGDDYHLVAKDREKILGMCRMIWQPEEKQFQFRQFYVRPNLMGGKIGSRLFSSAKERALKSEHSPKGIFLYTGAYNQAAQHMYEHWGFKITSSEDSIFSKEDDKLVEYIKMVLDFPNSKDAPMK